MAILLPKDSDPRKPDYPTVQARLAEAFAVLLNVHDRVQAEKQKEGEGDEHPR